MNFTAGQIADQLDGTIVGNRDVDINALSKIEEARKGSLTFLANPKYTEYIYSTDASATIVSNDFQPTEKITTTLIKVKDPYSSFTTILELFNSDKSKKVGISKKSEIDKSSSVPKSSYVGHFSKIGKKSIIGEHCIIEDQVYIGENVKIGDNSKIYPGTKILDDTIIGDNCIIHSNCSIGSDGFGFAPNDDGTYRKIPQTGNVIIGNDVEIGSNCSIDRATIGSTIVGEMTKIDNLVHIAHNVKIGKGCLITAGFAVAGSTEIGDFCTFAGQVGVAPHLKIGNNSIVASKSGVTRSLKGQNTYAGFPARDIKEHNRRQALINEIGRLREKLLKLSKRF